MVKLILLAVAMGLTGCTTLSNISKMNRVIPQIEHLVLLKDKAAASDPQTILLCGDDDYEERLLIATAKQMGWTVVSTVARLDHKPIHCTSMAYRVEP